MATGPLTKLAKRSTTSSGGADASSRRAEQDDVVEQRVEVDYQPEVPFDDLPGAPTEPAAVASLMMEAAKAVTGRWTGYQAPVGRGTRFGMLIEHPSFVLPELDFPRASRVLRTGLAELRFFDQRRGFRAYATKRGLRVQENDTQMRLDGPGVTATLGFTENNLVSAMTVGIG